MRATDSLKRISTSEGSYSSELSGIVSNFFSKSLRAMLFSLAQAMAAGSPTVTVISPFYFKVNSKVLILNNEYDSLDITIIPF